MMKNKQIYPKILSAALATTLYFGAVFPMITLPVNALDEETVVEEYLLDNGLSADEVDSLMRTYEIGKAQLEKREDQGEQEVLGVQFIQNFRNFDELNEGNDVNAAMANAFISCGADSVVGNLNSISSVYNQKMMKMFIEQLMNGSTTYTALTTCKNAYGYDDGDGDGIIEGNEAAAFLMGSTTKTMVKSNIENGSFESQLTSWQFSGDVSTKLKLGSIRTTNGKRMAFITTKTNETDSSYIYQTFKIPEYANTLTFTYDVISEEPLEWIDMGYNDKFAAKLITPDGTTVLASESTDTSEWLRIRDVNLPYGDNTTYHTGTITVTYDVSDLRGTSVKLLFSVEDSGDNTYDTAAVIDNISLTN